MLKRLFRWLDSLNKHSPLEKATIEWEETKAALLTALSNEEHYAGQVAVLTKREQRLAQYVGANNA